MPARREEIVHFYKQLDRSLFIDNENKKLAACDCALPIGYGQTISQPSLVLEMTLMLDLHKESKVLEIGTGSAYQTVLLAEFAREVYTVEIIPELAKAARARIERLNYSNVHFRIGDGSSGWLEHQPYDRIIVTAAASRLPEALLEQLRVGGKMVIPTGPPGDQDLCLVVKENYDTITVEKRGRVSFVEFRGRYGWKNNMDEKE